MYAVGRIGSYITGGLYTVSSPFHVFSGAVDIVAVEQPDGSFKSSPWYVRFGKFQGVLKAKEKVVNINVNGVDANFQMYLDQRGRAYFLMEEEGEEEDSALYPSSSSDEMDRQSHKNARPVLKSKSCSYDANNSYDGMDGQLQKNTRPVLKSKSCNYDTKKSNTGYQIDANNGKILARTNSRRSRILGLVFGHRTMRKEHYQEGYDDHTMVRISSWDRAEIAANLLEVQWSMNLATSKHREDNPLLFSVSDTSDVKKVNNTLSNHEQIRIGSSPYDIIEAGLDHSMSPEPTGSCNVKGETNPHSSFGEVECSVEESSVCMRSLSTMENVVETSIIGGSILGKKSEMISDISRNIDEPNVLCNDTAEDVISMVVTSDSQILCLSERSDKEQPYEQWDVAPASFNRYGKESGSDRAQAFMHFETSGRLTMETEASSKESHETLHIANRVPTKIHFDAETLLATAKLHLEDAIYQKMETVEAEMAHVEACGDCPQPKNPLPFINGHDGLNLEEPPTESELYAQTVTVAPIFNSAGGLAQFYGDSGLTKAVSIPAFESLEDEQCLFSDLDGHKHRETQCESNLSVGINNENHSSFCLEGSGDGLSTANRKLCSSLDHSVQEDQLDGLEKFMGNLDASSGPIGVLKVHGVGGAEVEQAVKSLPNTWSFTGGLNNAGLSHPLSHSLDSNSKSQEWTSDARDKKCDTNLDAVNENQLPQEHSDKQVAHVSGHQNGSATSGEPSTVVAPDGNWRLWPFSLKKSRSSKTMQLPLYDSKISDSECVSDINIDAGRDSNMPKPKGRKKMVKANTPTSEQLALLNLKEGSNTVTFTFSTAMLGQQKVDARIYLWKWNTRIVISDVDGTITKSDVLGQFMPLMGVDWSQTGVAHLFSAIKENGYQLLFLSARAISQAYLTRQFLFNLKQDGKALPDGPVVISPDGLFPSLFREVVRRTPHEFKIACLEDIRALFPHDYNPFYAGFGNRDTDEISYLKVGIPRGKIFIINPKGEVAVNRRVDTKSYTSLRTLVHSMFPSATSSEQENFNTWNYWKLPPPLIDV